MCSTLSDSYVDDIKRIPIAVAGVLLAACSQGGAASGGGAAADAGVEAFMGTWQVSGNIVAPWFTGPGFNPQPDSEILSTSLVLTATSAKGAGILACPAATFTAASAPPEGLFEGNVPDRAVAKSALGVDQEQIATLEQSCTSGGRDTVLSYHLVRADRMLLGLDNIVYQFDREAAAARQ